MRKSTKIKKSFRTFVFLFRYYFYQKNVRKYDVYSTSISIL